MLEYQPIQDDGEFLSNVIETILFQMTDYVAITFDSRGSWCQQAMHALYWPYHLGNNARKPDFVGCEQEKGKPDSRSAQSAQSICYSIPAKYAIETGFIHKSYILATLCNLAGCFEQKQFFSRPFYPNVHFVGHRQTV